jgi:ADP-heptose:LPS heptosyltransferase
MARGAKARGKRIAFGDGKRIIWGPWSKDIFRGNPNVASPGDERAGDIEWIDYYKGKRGYNRHDPAGKRWIWNYEFRSKPGEFFFSDAEEKFADLLAPADDFILIEPHVPAKSVAPNKDWGFQKFQAVADALSNNGHLVVQFDYGRPTLRGAQRVKTRSFREAAAVLSRAAAAILPEGGLHHAAAAVEVPAVVIFGGFIPAEVTGYEGHANLTAGAEACGSLTPCAHCRAALERITIDEVLQSAIRIMT